MTKEDIKCYRTNYNKKEWMKYSNGSNFIMMPLGILDAIRCLCDEVELLRGYKRTK